MFFHNRVFVFVLVFGSWYFSGAWSLELGDFSPLTSGASSFMSLFWTSRSGIRIRVYPCHPWLLIFTRAADKRTNQSPPSRKSQPTASTGIAADAERKRG